MALLLWGRKKAMAQDKKDMEIEGFLNFHICGHCVITLYKHPMPLLPKEPYPPE